jgi:hypothetical protein
VPDVTAIRFDYLAARKGPRRPLAHSWQNETRLPRAVRLELDHGRLDLPPIIVPIRQEFGSLCASPSAEGTCTAP